MLMRLDINPSGVLYEAPQASAPKNQLEVYQEGNLLRSRVNPNILYTNVSQSNEPDQHLPIAATKLHLGKGTYSKILCFSYKDIPLASLLRCETKPTILFNGQSGDESFPESFSEHELNNRIIQLADKYELIIFRHYLEHFENPGQVISSLLQLLDVNGTLFVEVPSCQEFFAARNPLFLWEQHKTFFTPNTFREWLLSHQLELVDLTQHGESIEPSLCAILTRTTNTNHLQHSLTHCPARGTREHLCISTSDVDDFIHDYREAWASYLSSISSNISFLGIGHAADRFLQLTNTHKHIKYLLDSNLAKSGRYLANIPNPIQATTDSCLLDSSLLILGVHQRDFLRISSLIRSKLNLKYRILSIYDYP